MKPLVWKVSPRAVALLAAVVVVATGAWFALRPPHSLPDAKGWGLGDWHQYLAQQRRTQIDRLRAYIDRGEFPRNADFSFQLTPYFVDDAGIRCAVGHLMERDGWRRDVERIARENNHVRVADVTSGPLVEWIRTSGLTQEECARIQPSYGWEGGGELDRGKPAVRDESERDRVRAHLTRVEAELVRDTLASLNTALERLLATLPKPQDASSAGFLSDAPLPAGGWRKVENRTASVAHVRVMELGPDGLKVHGSGWVTVPPQASAVSTPKEPGAAYFLEWKSEQPVAQAPVAVTRESAK